MGRRRSVRTRPVRRPHDDEFIRAVYDTTRRPELGTLGWPEAEIDGFIDMQFEAQSRHFATAFPDADHRVVLVGDEPAGRLIVDRPETEILMVDIALLPAFQGMGAGGTVVGALCREATPRASRCGATWLWATTPTGSGSVWDSRIAASTAGTWPWNGRGRPRGPERRRHPSAGGRTGRGRGRRGRAPAHEAELHWAGSVAPESALTIRQDSSTTSKSEPVIRVRSWRAVLFQEELGTPLMNQGEPLSATIIP